MGPFADQMEKSMTSAIKSAATRVLYDSELDTVAGGLLTPCGWSGCDDSYYYTPPPSSPTPTWSGWVYGW